MCGDQQSNFSYKAVAANVRFACGASAHLPEFIREAGGDKAFVIATGAAFVRHASVIEPVSDSSLTQFDEVQAHCPLPVVDASIDAYEESGADTIVAIGGGSTLGLGKILKAEHGAKFIAVPTTYTGSEMTPIYGRKIEGQKRTKVDAAALPDMVVYDPELTLGLPAHQTASTGMNSLAHAVEALYPEHPNPIAWNLAGEAIGLHARALPLCVADGRNIDARIDALRAGFLGGVLVSMVGVALHHALGHVLGGLFDLDHGDYNSAVLPHVVAFNATAVPRVEEVISDRFEVADPGEAIFDFAKKIHAPTSLKELGMPETGIAEVTQAIVAKNPRNPRPITHPSMKRLLSAAYEGLRPSVEYYRDV
ncbi:maleylacetate reductase [Parasphingopyxis sp.]|uniref:maleylacetate reductase n=1 Tax=Parasphingopyxis sp. TaxID=1920299 RepID=UPI00261D6443|nr:maleylacetate reductase [Parasphingopyxis sp.]